MFDELIKIKKDIVFVIFKKQFMNNIFYTEKFCFLQQIILIRKIKKEKKKINFAFNLHKTKKHT